LTSQLFEIIRSQVKHRFGDAIVSLGDGPNGVVVAFRSGASERFDLVVSGEGLHSTTRALVFGPEAHFARYLRYCFAIWSAGRVAVLGDAAFGPSFFSRAKAPAWPWSVPT
jgi:2-polyprenyl-6-methoxyphenol hydroxylase-like FAD-dependent oxidoreductase